MSLGASSTRISNRMAAVGILCTVPGSLIGLYFGHYYGVFVSSESTHFDSSGSNQLDAVEAHRRILEAYCWVGAALGFLTVVIIAGILSVIVQLPALWRRAYRRPS